MIKILQQGKNYLAVFKEGGIATVPSKGYFGTNMQDLICDQVGFKLYPVHRLDRVTSGIVLFAKSSFAEKAITNAFYKHLVKKKYYAVCCGQPKESNFVVDIGLKKIGLNNKKFSAKQVADKNGEKAITSFVVKKYIGDKYCLIEVAPKTGKFHQIRAHLEYKNLPILGDTLYGGEKIKTKNFIGLYAYEISLPGPKGENIFVNSLEYYNVDNFISDLNILPNG